MPIPFTCPHCGHSSLVAEQYAGKSGPCASCGQTITVPIAKEESAVSGKASKAPLAIILGVVLMGTCIVGGAVLTALILPAVGAGRMASQRVQCTNNLRQIALAMHNYHDVYQSFPPAYTVDANGNKLHSWRTLLLPYLEQQALYQQIDLNKPWDDPANQPFANVVIPTYCCPSDLRGSTNATSYMAVVGQGTILESDQPNSMANITDGTANTLLVVEVRDQTSSWMAPVDLDLSSMKMAVNGGNGEICSHHPGGANVAMADGSATFLAEQIDVKLLRNLITRADGNPTR